jgi:hypothetical protein
MVTTFCYKVLDLNLHDDDWPASMEDILNRQAQEGWELVTSFQRAHEALMDHDGRHLQAYQYAVVGCEGRPQASPGRLRAPAQVQGSE